MMKQEPEGSQPPSVQAVLGYLSTTEVGRRVPDPAEEDGQSEASGWKLREREERGEERRLEAEELGAEIEELLQFFPTPASWSQQKRINEVISFVLSFIISLARSALLGQARTEAGGATASRKDRGQEPVKTERDEDNCYRRKRGHDLYKWFTGDRSLLCM